LNPRPRAYESLALPLSYPAKGLWSLNSTVEVVARTHEYCAVRE
jgi:hypothetical protein